MSHDRGGVLIDAAGSSRWTFRHPARRPSGRGRGRSRAAADHRRFRRLPTCIIPSTGIIGAWGKRLSTAERAIPFAEEPVCPDPAHAAQQPGRALDLAAGPWHHRTLTLLHESTPGSGPTGVPIEAARRADMRGVRRQVPAMDRKRPEESARTTAPQRPWTDSAKAPANVNAGTGGRPRRMYAINPPLLGIINSHRPTSTARPSCHALGALGPTTPLA